MISPRPCLTIVGGKGGVGRSTVTAGISLHHARAGRRVVAIDAVGDGGLAKAFGQPRSLAEHDDQSEPDTITIEGHDVALLTLSTQVSLRQYLQRYVPLPTQLLTTTTLSPLTAVFDFVAKAAPAVTEILTIGKIGFEATEGGWDNVVVDGPATGHIVDLVTAPSALTDIVKAGPLIDQAAWLDDLLNDPTASTMVLVTTPEELPVTELGELKDALEAEKAPAVSLVVVNRVPPEISPAGMRSAEQLCAEGSSLSPAINVALARHEISTRQFTRLRSHDLPLVSVPEAPVPFQAVAECLAEKPVRQDGDSQ